MVKIRKGEPGDIGAIMLCYDKARQFMRSQGNNTQWINGYPSQEIVKADITAGNCYVGIDDSGALVMCFAFIISADSTYELIEQGKWLNDEQYGTIHRLGSTGKLKGMLRKCVEYCYQIIPNLRLDTHADNLIMQRGVTALGFQKCGIIYCVDGSPRIAYQLNEAPKS